MSKTNDDIVINFYRKEKGKTKHLESFGDKIVSYDTCVAQHYGVNGVIINITIYDNRTITDHAFKCRKWIHFGHKKCVIYLSDVPEGTRNLREYYKTNYND